MSSKKLEGLWNKYCACLFAFIRSRIKDDFVAQDILQEVFIRVHRNLCCKSDWEKPDAWFYQIARNLILDHLRQQREWAEIPENLPDEREGMAEEDLPEARLALSLREVVDELPEPYRQALVATEYEGLSQKELADQLGISFSGAKSRVQRARHKLRSMLLACCHFELDRRGRVIDYYQRCCGCNPNRE